MGLKSSTRRLLSYLQSVGTEGPHLKPLVDAWKYEDCPDLWEAPVDPTANTTGSLTLTLREGEDVLVDTPLGDTLVFHVTSSDKKRVSINIRAPRAYSIRRNGVGFKR